MTSQQNIPTEENVHSIHMEILVLKALVYDLKDQLKKQAGCIEQQKEESRLQRLCILDQQKEIRLLNEAVLSLSCSKKDMEASIQTRLSYVEEEIFELKRVREQTQIECPPKISDIGGCDDKGLHQTIAQWLYS
jgi:hypothetical protein